MINDLEYANRQLLPRWVPFSQIQILNPTGFTRLNNNQLEKENYKDLENTWTNKKTVPLAIEIISSSHLLDIEDTVLYKEAIDFLFENHLDVIEINQYLSSILGKEKSTESSPQNNIQKLKKIVRFNNTDDSAWVDLAFFYSIQGQKKQAEKCINTALYLNPTSIFTIKGITKYLLLTGNIDEALWVLNKNDDYKSNPQIISTEISIAEAYNLKSKLLRKGHSIVKEGNITSFEKNELFATFATMEFNSGNSKMGQKLFSNSLIYPNENILAQARYLSSKFNKTINTADINIPGTYERDSWIAYKNENFEDVLKYSIEWFYFQPFSVTPALMNSFINSMVFNNEKKSIEMTKKALRIAPNNFSLLNNQVVSLYRSNNLKEGDLKLKELEKCPISKEEDRKVLLATEGLADYRNKRIVEGKEKYIDAINYFKRKNDIEKYCRAVYFLAYEKKCIEDLTYIDEIKEIKTIAEKFNISDIKSAISRNFSNIK